MVRRGLSGRVRDRPERLLRARRPPRPVAPARSDIRLPDGTDTDSNCTDFTITNHPTPGAANQGFVLDPGPRVSLQTTSPGGGSGYIKHDDSDDLVVVAPVTADSSSTDKQDATFVETAGLANPNCVSFESVNKPGSYLRHQNFQFHLQPNDGSSLFSMDATFCPQARQQRPGHVVPVGGLPRQVHPQLQQRRLPRQQRRLQPLGHRHRLASRHELAGGHPLGARIVRRGHRP